MASPLESRKSGSLSGSLESTRMQAVGMNSATFSVSVFCVVSGQGAAVMCTLVGSAKPNKRDLQLWLADLRARIAEQPDRKFNPTISRPEDRGRRALGEDIAGLLRCE